MIRIDRRTTIDDADLEESFVHSSGPGGQNVNKLSTAVQLRFDSRRAAGLPDDVQLRLATLAGRRMTRDGVLVITAQRFRSQGRNRQDAMERLIELVRAAAVRPVLRRPTRPSAGERQRRLGDKSHRASIKRGRSAQAEE